MIADVAGADWPKRCRESLVSLCAADIDDDESLGVKLLSAIREAFNAKDADSLATQELLEHLVNQDTDAPWAALWAHDLTNDNIKGLGRNWQNILSGMVTVHKTRRQHNPRLVRKILQIETLLPAQNRLKDATTQQRERSTYEKALFYSLQMMQHGQTMLHVSQLRFSIVKPWFVALLHHFREVIDGPSTSDALPFRSALVH